MNYFPPCTATSIATANTKLKRFQEKRPGKKMTNSLIEKTKVAKTGTSRDETGEGIYRVAETSRGTLSKNLSQASLTDREIAGLYGAASKCKSRFKVVGCRGGAAPISGRASRKGLLSEK